MKIDILTPFLSRNGGGLLDAVRYLYKSENFNNVAKTVYGLNDEYSELDMDLWKPLDVRSFDSKTKFMFSRSLKRALLLSTSPILHLHGLWLYPHILLNVCKRKRNMKVIITPHGMLDVYAVSQRSVLKTTLANLLFANKSFKNCDCFHALCKSELESIRAYGIDRPVAIIPNGVDMPQVRVDRTDRTEKKHLLYLGRLHPKKGLDLLINALGKMKCEHPEVLQEWVLDIVGWGQGDFCLRINELVEELYLDGDIVFHGGVFGAEKEKLYINSDAFILPSYSEGLPMTVLEAWSYALPVIMTPACNIPEGFENDAALSVDPNIESIEKGLLTFFKLSNEERLKMGNNGYQMVKEQFTWDVSAKKMLRLYDWVLNGGEKPEFVYF